MQAIKRQYIVDEYNNKIAVQLNIGTFEKIEKILEDYALVKLMKENDSAENLSIDEAKKYYKKLKKAN